MSKVFFYNHNEEAGIAVEYAYIEYSVWVKMLSKINFIV